MQNLTVADVNADISMLMEGFSSDKRIVPSSSHLLKMSVTLPLTAISLSFLSAVIIFLTGYKVELTLLSFFDYFLSDGWIFVAPTIVVGLLFSLMTYNNIMLYLAVPEDIRQKSLLLSHFKLLAKRTILLFLKLMVAAIFLSGVSTWFAFAISGLLFALLFIVSLIVGSEINRLGVGIVVDKISSLVKSI